MVSKRNVFGLMAGLAYFAMTLPAYADEVSSAEQRSPTEKVSFALGSSAIIDVMDPSGIRPANFLLGFKMGRFVVGLGGTFSHRTGTTTYYHDPSSPTPVDHSMTWFAVAPELQWAILRWGRRFEFLSVISMGLGRVATDVDAHGVQYLLQGQASTSLFVWRGELGLRTWLHPQMAAQLLIGAAGNHPSNDFDRLLGGLFPERPISPIVEFGLLASF